MTVSSRIFLKNRALGFVSNEVPCVIRFSKRRDEYLISTCVGKAFHTYGSNHLTLLTVSDTTEDEITCMATEGGSFYTSSGNVIYAWKRNAEIKFTYKGHLQPVYFILPFGGHFISIDEGNTLKVWEFKTQESILTLNFAIDLFKISAVVHPATYRNKILLGSEQGLLQLWNLKTSKLIYTFNGWESSVTALEQAPALDVIAIGLKDGRIILHNIKYDESVVDFKQDWGSVTSISFRTDGAPIMVSGGTAGHLVIWNLEEKKVASQILEAHKDVVCSVICIPGEPLMITSSSDNSLKMWIFDQPDFGGRLLRFREGHMEAPNIVRFYDENHLLSAGNDSSLRVFNIITESLNYSMGRASYNSALMKKKKWKSEYLLMPPIIDISMSLTREKDWDNIAAIHRNSTEVTSWSYERRKLGTHRLLPERLQNITRVCDPATCVHVTNCGNFVLIGYSSGHLERFNIQSGIQRCSYGVKAAHKGAIRGVACDSLNQIVISGCNYGIIKIWHFKPGRGSTCPKRIAAFSTDSGVSFFRPHGESFLIGIVLDNYALNLLDLEAKKIVRRMTGHTGPITDAAFSPDARWIITSSVDRTIRVWDIPTGCAIDIFKVDVPCLKLSFSPNGSYLATVHANSKGIYLWTNKTLFSHVSFKPIKETEDIPLLDFPGTGMETTVELEDEDSEEENVASLVSKDQIDGLVTMSDLATSRWKHLLDLDVIKMRNKPKEPPKAPPTAPFFLPTLPGKDIIFDFSSVSAEDGVRTIKLNKLKNYTVFGQMLAEADARDFTPVINKLKSMSPSGLDFEINSLGLESEGSIELISKFMSLIKYMLSTNRDFELSQAYFGLFIKIHGKTIIENEDLCEKLKDLKDIQRKNWEMLEDDIMFCLSAIDILKS